MESLKQKTLKPRVEPMFVTHPLHIESRYFLKNCQGYSNTVPPPVARETSLSKCYTYASIRFQLIPPWITLLN